MIKRLWVRISTRTALDGIGVKDMQGQIMYQSWFIYEKKENTGSQMGHTKKTHLKKLVV
jgi:hypothetical protein